MLISLSIENFRSYREEQTLNLVASGRYKDHEDHLAPVPGTGESLLRGAVIYGANGSGKSNLMAAFSFARNLILEGTEPGKTIQSEPFRFSKRYIEKPTMIELRFVAGDEVFCYGFKVTEKEVKEEWLLLIRGSRETELFERVAKADGKVRIQTGGALADRSKKYEKIAALTKVGVRSNQLFLTAIRENLEPDDYGPLLKSVLTWIESVTFIPPDAPFMQLAEWISKDDEFSRFVGEFLRDASTGVVELEVMTSEVDENSGFPKQLIQRLIDDTKPGEVSIVPIGPMGEVIAERLEEPKIKLRTVRMKHSAEAGETASLPLHEESDGTQRLTHLLPALYSLRKENCVFFIDELERSLHPVLARKFVEFFLGACRSSRSQLIATTHESHLMDLDLLRRDELWFAEKNEEGATALYALSEFSIRTDLKVSRGYLQGRFGAIPFLGGLDRLMERLREDQG